MKTLLLGFATLLALVSVRATAAPATYVWADGRFEIHSPQYYSSTTADLSVSLRADLPFGSTVRARYGLGGTNGEWQDVHEINAPAVGPWEWRADFSATLHERSWDGARTKLEFLFVVTTPDGSVHYEKGGDSVMGFYEAALPEPGTISADPQAEYQRLVVYVIQRN